MERLTRSLSGLKPVLGRFGKSWKQVGNPGVGRAPAIRGWKSSATERLHEKKEADGGLFA